MSDLLEALLTCDITKLKALMGSNPDVNSPVDDTENLTLLHIAAGTDGEKSCDVLSYLLDLGADPNSRSSDGLTPVHVATMWNNYPKLQKLLLFGGNPYLCDNENKNAFDMALQYKADECYNLLSNFKIDMCIKSYNPAYKKSNDAIVEITECLQNSSIIDSSTTLKQQSQQNDESVSETMISCFHHRSTSKDCIKDFNNSKIATNEVLTITDETKSISIKYTPHTSVCSVNFEFKDCASEIPPTLNISSSSDGTNNTITLDETSSTIKSDLLTKKFLKEIKYDEDDESVLIEEHVMPTVSDESCDSYYSTCSTQSDWKAFYKKQESLNSDSASTDSLSPVAIPSELMKLSNSEIFWKLKSCGDNPGPVLEGTRQVYLQRLARIMINSAQPLSSLPKPKYSPEVYLYLEGKLDMKKLQQFEQMMSEDFDKGGLVNKWREGNQRCSFNYFLLDPRVTRNLPSRAHMLSQTELFQIFIDALFYVGKGTKGRPYQHLYEAAKSMKSPILLQLNSKIVHILDIWNAGLGVVSLHCFQSSIPVEAFTREACIIEAIGLLNLTNIKKGNFYGIATRWTMSRKRQLGVFFLSRALNMYLLEGERLIRYKDIKN